MSQATAPTTAAAGIVTIQAQTIDCASRQRTADARRADPTPALAPAIVCVVLTARRRGRRR